MIHRAVFWVFALLALPFSLFAQTPPTGNKGEEGVSAEELKNRLGAIKSTIDHRKGEANRYMVESSEVPFYSSPDKRIGVKILVDPATSGPTLASLCRFTFLPMGRIENLTLESATVLFVVKGAISIQIGQGARMIPADGSMLIPPLTQFSVVNGQDKITELLMFHTPAGPESRYRTEWARAHKEGIPAFSVEGVASTPMVPGAPK